MLTRGVPRATGASAASPRRQDPGAERAVRPGSFRTYVLRSATRTDRKCPRVGDRLSERRAYLGPRFTAPTPAGTVRSSGGPPVHRLPAPARPAGLRYFRCQEVAVAAKWA